MLIHEKMQAENAYRMVRVYVPFRLPCPELGIAERREIELRGAASIRPGGVAQKQDAQHPDGAGNHHWDRGGHLCGCDRKSRASAGRATTEQSGRQLCLD